MQTKVTTVIVNDTHQRLTMKAGNRLCFARLTSVKEGAEYRMQLDLNWTYQEFLVQGKSDATNRVFLNSDDCCDYERITITEKSDGKLEVHMLLREQFRVAPCCTIVEEEDGTGSHSKQVYTMSGWTCWLSKFLQRSNS